MAGVVGVPCMFRAGSSRLISYPSGDTGQTLVFTDQVLRHLDRHRQLRPRSKEAGGQLFARFEVDGRVGIERATGPRRSDRRGACFFYPDREAERREIRRNFKKDLHYVGDWHTHPESCPHPSALDINSFREMFVQSRHGLQSFVMVIVGTEPPPDGLYVALCGSGRPERLTAAASPQRSSQPQEPRGRLTR